MGLETDGFAERVREAIARYGRTRVGVFLGTSTAGILQTELAYRRRDPVSGALPDDFHLPHDTQFLFAGRIHPRLFRAGRHGDGDLDRLLVQRQSLRRRRPPAGQRHCIDAAIVGGVDSLCLTTLYGFASLQLTSPTPAGLTTLRATASRSARAPPSRCSNAPRILRQPAASCCSAPANRATPTTCPSPHPEGLGARMAMAAALRSAHLSACRYRLHQPARHGHAGQRRRRRQGRGRAVRRPSALQFNQGCHRPHARRSRRSRSHRSARWH
jgi:3-oxoacyl-[acyl-carrier-protein] synthase-1